jgi:hypothetical protein
VLGIICLHDQLGRNGLGCTAGHRRLADLARMGTADLSNMLTDLRAWGYLNSNIDPKDRRRRVHRVIYNDHDKTWDRNSWSPTQQSNWAAGQRSEQDSWENGEGSLVKSGKIVGEIGVENEPKPLAPLSKNDRTYVNKEEHIRSRELVEGTDCAEARLAMKVNEVETYLTTTETLAASKDRDQLRFERVALEKLASDACLPETFNERAARLLSQIGFS